MNLEMKKQLTNQKRNFKILNIKYLNADDKKKIQYVANHLNDITVKCVPMKKRMTTCSINNLKIFGDKCYQEASLFTSLNYVPVFLNHATFTCRVGFQIDEKTMNPNIHSGEVQYFQVPKYLDVSSSVFLSHEFIHGLKETNYEEFILKATLSDVIPIFYELYRKSGTDKYFMTAFFALLIFIDVFNAFNARTHKINLLSNIRRNKVFILIITFIVFMQIIMIYYGGTLFRTSGLTIKEFIITIILSFTVIPIDNIRKLWLRQRGIKRGV